MNARVKEQRAFWAARGFAPLSIHVHEQDRDNIEAMIRIRIGDRLTDEVKSIVNVKDFAPFIHRRALARPSLTDVAQLRHDLSNLRSVPTKLKKRFTDFHERYLELVDYDRICEKDGETEFEIAQAFCMRYAMSYLIAGEYQLLRGEINGRPTKAPDRGQQEIFDTEPRPELLPSGDGEDTD